MRKATIQIGFWVSEERKEVETPYGYLELNITTHSDAFLLINPNGTKGLQVRYNRTIGDPYMIYNSCGPENRPPIASEIYTSGARSIAKSMKEKQIREYEIENGFLANNMIQFSPVPKDLLDLFTKTLDERLGEK